MDDTRVQVVGVIGCGLMGSGIAQVCAQAGYRTIVREVDEATVEAGLGRIGRFLENGVARGKVTTDVRDATMRRLEGTTNFEALAESDLVIEAIVENLDAKTVAFAAVEEVVSDKTVFCSNTSSVCITELAASTKRPDKFIGLHFFSPVPIMGVVEVIRGLSTVETTYQQVIEFARSLGKQPVTAPDQPGFIVNRLLVPYLLSAIRAYESGCGTLQDIDKAMTLGCGHPMGPFALADFVGLDTTYYIANIMHDEFRDPVYAPPPILKRLVLAGRLGRKSGHGFFKY
ncbi:MAG: 3-hydroxybutyryl-CoA dehydrogenase [Acidobacteriota bacterium]|nr:3-hydroxybutyryl-CoA dehydrogenase [Acidobacteriota bacterium]